MRTAYSLRTSRAITGIAAVQSIVYWLMTVLQSSQVVISVPISVSCSFPLVPGGDETGEGVYSFLSAMKIKAIPPTPFHPLLLQRSGLQPQDAMQLTFLATSVFVSCKSTFKSLKLEILRNYVGV